MATGQPKVKLLCSFGGKILPRPSDGALRYAGGHTRIISLRRSSTLEDFLHKISQISNGAFNDVKYQLPDEDLDALISVSSQEDLDNMMEEFDRVNEASNDGYARIRIFLFTLSDLGDPNGVMDTGQSYIEAVNGIGLRRKDILVSASSSEGMSPLILSPTQLSVSQDLPRLGVFRDENIIGGRIENQNDNAGNIHPVYVTAGSVVSVGCNADQIQGKIELLGGAGELMGNSGGILMPNLAKIESLGIGGDPMSGFGGNLMHNIGKAESMGVACDHMSNFGGNLMTNQVRAEENLYRADRNGNNSNSRSNNKGHHHQPLNQLPPLRPMHIHPWPNSYVPPLHLIPCQTLRLEDCQLCEKSLPHAHSDTLINEHANGNISSTINESIPLLQSHHSEDPTRLQALIWPDNAMEGKIQADAVAAGLYSHQLENERVFHPNVEAIQPTGVTWTAGPPSLQASLTGAVAESAPMVETVPTGGQFGGCGLAPEISHLHEKESLVHSKVETFDPPKVLHPRPVFSGALTSSGPEPNIDNVATRSQIGAHAFSQLPKIPQKHDNERLLINLNVPAPAGVGLPGDTQSSHRVFANPLQSHFLDPFPVQTMSHDVVQPHTLVKQDVVATKQFGQDVGLANNGIFKAVVPTSRIIVPEIPYDDVRPMNGMMESLHVSTFEPSGILEHVRPAAEHVRPAAAVNQGTPMLKPEDFTLIIDKNHEVRPPAEGNGVFLGTPHFMSGIVPEGNSVRPINQFPTASAELKPDYPLAAADNSQTFRSQAGGNVIYLGNAFIASGIVSEGNSFIPSNQMPPSSLNLTLLQSLQPAETRQASTVMANHGALLSYSQEMRIQPGLPNEQLHVMHSYTCSATPLYNNNTTITVEPVGDRKDETPCLHPKDMPSNVDAPLSGIVPINYSNTSVRNGHTDEFQVPTPSDSLFCNYDPQKILGNMQMVPPTPNKVSSREFVAPVDLCCEEHLVNSKGVEEGAFQHLPVSANTHLCMMEQVQSMQGEEHNKQEVQGLAEQIMATVLQPSVPSALVSFPHERRDSDLQSNRESGLCEANALTTNVAAVGDNKVEVDKMTFGIPITDGIGQLQIIKNSDLEELRELGSGTFGTVYHGKWRGSDVAIKRINDRCFAGKPSEEERMRADFWNEACNLADLHHPNIVAFYGVVLDGPGGSFATVTEFMVNGSLRRALQKNDKTLDKRRCLLIAMDVAFGMEYLHGKNMIHFDLKSDNLLVNLRDPQRPICKVADLGLSKVKHQTLISGGVRGTLPWMAPELLNGSDSMVSNKVDVFSYGIVMWELLTGEEPYGDLHYGAIIGGIVSNNLRPKVPESCDPEWRSLMEQCWSSEPSERPSFTEIASRLRAMAASLPQK